MAKQWVDWSNWKEELAKAHGPHPLSRPLPSTSIAEQAAMMIQGVAAETHRSYSQPDKREFEAAVAKSLGVSSDEELRKRAEEAERRWNGTFRDFFSLLNKPVEEQRPDKSWGCRGPIALEKRDAECERISAIQVSTNGEDGCDGY